LQTTRLQLTEISPYAAYLEGSSDSDTLIIAFSFRDTPPHSFSLVKTLAPYSASKLFLNCVHGTWYQEGIPPFGSTVEDTVRGLRNYAKDLGVSTVITMGTSMGGTAAIMYGLQIGARVLSFSPEVALRHAHSRSIEHLNNKPASQWDNLLPLMRSVDASRLEVICGDGDLVDLLQASLIRETTHHVPRVMAGAAHGALQAIHKAGLVDDLLMRVLQNEPVSSLGGRLSPLPDLGVSGCLNHDAPSEADLLTAYYKLLHSFEAAPAVLFCQAGRRLKRIDADFAIRCLVVAVGLEPTKRDWIVDLTRLLRHQHRFRAALAIASSAQRTSPGDVQLRFELAVSYACLNPRSAEALQLLSSIEDLDPLGTPDRIKGARTLLALERKDLARRWLESVMSSDPNNSRAADLLATIQDRRG